MLSSLGLKLSFSKILFLGDGLFLICANIYVWMHLLKINPKVLHLLMVENVSLKISISFDVWTNVENEVSKDQDEKRWYAFRRLVDRLRNL